MVFIKSSLHIYFSCRLLFSSSYHCSFIREDLLYYLCKKNCQMFVKIEVRVSFVQYYME